MITLCEERVPLNERLDANCEYGDEERRDDGGGQEFIDSPRRGAPPLAVANRR
jgi:hypothetical protein